MQENESWGFGLNNEAKLIDYRPLLRVKMKLVTSQLVEGENTLSFTSSKDSWVRELVADIASQGSHFLSPLDIQLKLTKLEPDYYLKGEISFEVEQCCARCAENFGLKSKFPFSLSLLQTKSDVAKIKKTANTKVDDAEEAADLDITYFEGPEIDLAPIIREQFFLSLPYQAVCRADCLGMCQTCGKNLNQGHCRCFNATNVPSPFEALRSFKKDPNIERK